MKNISERQKDVLSIIANLDISPTLYENANAKYKAITKYLCDCGIDADMYPQGSFAFGTVVRPNAKNPEAGYDLDFICQVKGSRFDYTPSELRNKIEDALNANGTYGGKLKIFNECFTIEYADINGTGFAIDIVPATDESAEIKTRLISKNPSPQLIDTAIAIPQYRGEHGYGWITNNPKGFRAWFEQINAPFLAASRNNYRIHLFDQNRRVYASVEDIPSALERSALQRVIQILKYHRDVYYAKLKDGDDIKPISAIINTVVARISSKVAPSLSIFELLEHVLNELTIYAQQQNLSTKDFMRLYESRSVFSQEDVDVKWYIPNPANPEDNLANKWNIDSKIPTYFFRWVSVAQNDLITSLHNADDHDFGVILENGFGYAAVSSAIGNKYHTDVAPKPIVVQKAARPYHSL